MSQVTTLQSVRRLVAVKTVAGGMEVQVAVKAKEGEMGQAIHTSSLLSIHWCMASRSSLPSMYQQGSKHCTSLRTYQRRSYPASTACGHPTRHGVVCTYHNRHGTPPRSRPCPHYRLDKVGSRMAAPRSKPQSRVAGHPAI